MVSPSKTEQAVLDSLLDANPGFGVQPGKHRRYVNVRLCNDVQQGDSMPPTLRQQNDRIILEFISADPPQDATEIIGSALSAGAAVVVLPVSLLGPNFFHLRTGVAGEMLQKFVNYGVKLAILGDVSVYTATSSALRDFIYESNRGETIWFVADRHELEQRLG
jgi:hypothetical protein